MSDQKRIAARVEALAGDERLIIESLLSRLERGRREYGPWNVSDGRDFMAEAFEEVLDAMHYTAAELVRRRRLQSQRRKLIYVCHPYSDDVLENTIRVRLICRKLVNAGLLPLATSLYLPMFIDEQTERELALELCVELVGICDELWVYGDRISDGMQREIVEARARKMPVRFITEAE